MEPCPCGEVLGLFSFQAPSPFFSLAFSAHHTHASASLTEVGGFCLFESISIKEPAKMAEPSVLLHKAESVSDFNLHREYDQGLCAAGRASEIVLVSQSDSSRLIVAINSDKMSSRRQKIIFISFWKGLIKP